METLSNTTTSVASVLQHWGEPWLRLLAPYWALFCEQAGSAWDALQEQKSYIFVELPTSAWQAIPRNALVPLLAIVLVFWPILVTLLYAFMTASTWIVWLFTSVLLGCVQLLYVTYQFFMITGDLCGLSILKSYSMARHYFLSLVDTLLGYRQPRKSSRRKWREKLYGTNTYEDFLKIRLEPKEEVPDPTDSALPPIRDSVAAAKQQKQTPSSLPSSPRRKTETMVRSNSFDSQYINGNMSLSPTSISAESPPSPQSSLLNKMGLTRARSFGTFTQIFQQQTNADNAPQSPNGSNVANNNIDHVVSHELGERTAYLLVTTTERLTDARYQVDAVGDEESWNRLKYLLSAVVKRNHLNLDDLLVENARTVSNTGRYGLTSQSRQVIRAFYQQVQKGLDLLADGPPATVPQTKQSTSRMNSRRLSNNSTSEKKTEKQLSISSSLTPPLSPRSSTSSLAADDTMHMDGVNDELSDRLLVIRKMKQNMGRTALMLSGGGAQAMYHIGTIRALIQSKLYHDIQVISGTSGGSIAAAMCALKTPEELFSDVCVPTVSTDFMLTGEQARKNIRWFPSIPEMASYWLKHKLLMDNKEFRRTCEFYYGDTTFEEAFEKTGKHVCITVSASRASGDTAQRLLLNHISTPRVTLASAVAASCALPGVMAPAKLLTKNSVGALEPFEVDGVEWIDGSVQADLPFQRISTLFCVSNFIVSQTNFHVVPFLNKAHHPNQKSVYWRLFQTMEWDIRSRALKLSKLGLFPRIFGQDISKVFKQKYHGNLTLVPRFTTMQTFGLNALSNPTVEDMKDYIKHGEIAAWPYLNAIRDMIRLEKVIDDCLSRLEHRLGSMNPEWYDEIESIASSNHHPFMVGTRVKISSGNSLASGSHGGTEKIKRHARKLEEENKALKEKLQQLQQLLHGSGLQDAESP